MAADEIVDGGEDETGLDRTATCHADLDEGEPTARRSTGSMSMLGTLAKACMKGCERLISTSHTPSPSRTRDTHVLTEGSSMTRSLRSRPS